MGERANLSSIIILLVRFYYFSDNNHGNAYWTKFTLYMVASYGYHY